MMYFKAPVEQQEPAPQSQPSCTAHRARLLSPDMEMRHQRRVAWRVAMSRVDLAKALWKLADAEWFYQYLVGGGVDRNHARREELLALYRRAVAAQIMTPAYDQPTFKWKLTAAKDGHLPIAKHQIEAAIAADEAWFREHPSKGGRGPRKADVLKLVA